MLRNSKWNFVLEVSGLSKSTVLSIVAVTDLSTIGDHVAREVS